MYWGILMTHNELRDYIDKFDAAGMVKEPAVHALRAVVELHTEQDITFPDGEQVILCSHCSVYGVYVSYPCKTIRTVEKELI
jgi:hypothetical protein